MSTLSAQQIEKYLREYSLGIEYWDNEAGDTFLVLGARELLQKSIGVMSQAQLDELHLIDSNAEKLLKNYSGDDTFDVSMLKDIVSIIRNGSLSKAA